MAWTTPRTWVANELVTAAQMNTHVRDNLSVLTPAYAYPTSGATYDAQNQTANSIWVGFILGSGTLTYTTSGITIVSDNSFQPTVAGIYHVRVQVQVGTTGYDVQLVKTGGLSIGRNSGHAAAPVECSAIARFNGTTDVVAWQGFGRAAGSENWPSVRAEMFLIAAV